MFSDEAQFGTPKDVAALAAFLAALESGFITT
jgi:NAD(P)-dependent dehydrogenase (short-subunit alcohol dehydrogenase family)